VAATRPSRRSRSHCDRVNHNGTGSQFVVEKNCENLDVELEAVSIVYSTVQYFLKQYLF